jgi:hypothetical protein
MTKCICLVELEDVSVSNLVHEKAFRCLTDLQELEPETYNQLEKKIERRAYCCYLWQRKLNVFH